MVINLTKENQIYKRLFTLKQQQRDGLILNIHHTNKDSHKIRFINVCFSRDGQVITLGDNEGNIFVVDFNANKFWNIPKIISSSTIIKFSNFKESDILVGTRSGVVYIIDIQSGFISGELVGHAHPVTEISYGCDFLCLTSSSSEAIVWDMKTNTKIQILNLNHSCSLKHVVFMPVTSNILACFDDDYIQIWNYNTCEMKVQIPPFVWFGHPVKSLAFTLDGKMMVLGCHSPHLALFLLNNYKLLKFITLPEYIQTIKHIDFISQINDGGSNKILTILSGRGSIYFYDIEKNIIVSELNANYEIFKYDYSVKGNYIVCLLCSGDVNVYDVVQYIVVPLKLKAIKPNRSTKVKKSNKYPEKVDIVKEQIKEMLNIEKLRIILKECGEYPDVYRNKIWEQLLELPNNQSQYNAIINHRMIISFEDLCKKYPLEDKRNLKNLKRLLDNLVTWSPFFFHVYFLPLFVFPFVKVFHNKPIICFEAVCTIILNWCQFWFEYFPLPPINVLAMVENLLLEHDPELLHHLEKNKIYSKLYAWPILKTIFSEILTAQAWKTFWDHVLTNEPAFLLCGVVAYNILQKGTLLSLNHEKDFHCFYNTHHPIDVKKLLAKSYYILMETSETNHPRQYLSLFKKLQPGEYPNFCDYPKTIINLKSEKERAIKGEMKHLKTDELDLYRKRLINLKKMQIESDEEEEKRRVLEMEKAIKKQLLDEQTQLQNYYHKLEQLRRRFRKEEETLVSLKDQMAKGQYKKRREQYLSSVLDDVTLHKREKDYTVKKIEDELLYHYSELLRNKYKIKKLLNDEDDDMTIARSSSESSLLEKQQDELAQGIDFIRKSDKPQDHLKVMNLANGILAMDALIKKIEMELDKEKHGDVDENTADKTVFELQAETRSLVSEVNNLLQLLIALRSDELNG